MKPGFRAHKLRLARAGFRAQTRPMSPRLAPALLALCVALAPLSAQEKKPWLTVPPDSGLTTYYLGLITKGPNANAGTTEERAKVQAEHQANIRRLADEGKLLVSGPCPDHGALRGIFIFKCDSLEEAQELAASDPEVQAGRLKIEIHPWQTEKGSIRDPEFARAR
jgi:uncharacterized protein YciI